MGQRVCKITPGDNTARIVWGHTREGLVIGLKSLDRSLLDFRREDRRWELKRGDDSQGGIG